MNTYQDQDYIYLVDFLFSFEFPNKELIKEQMHFATVRKEQSEYHTVFYFEVSKECKCLPVECNGMPVFIQVKNPESLTCCELFVRNGKLQEYRIYNIDNSKLDIKKLHEGATFLELK